MKLFQERSSRKIVVLEKQGSTEYFCKVYDASDFLSRMRNRFFPKTLKEADMLGRLKEKGLPVPEIQGHMLHAGASALITRAIEPAQSLWEVDPSIRGTIMLEMAVLLLKHGFSHRDMHPGNIILDSSGRAFLIDAYEISAHGRIGKREIIRLFAQIFNASNISPADLEKHLVGFQHIDDSATLAAKIVRSALRTKRRYVRKRVKRSMREGSFSTVLKTGNFSAWIRRGEAIDVESIIARHEANLANGIDILKVQDKTQLSRVDQYCVKSYRKSWPFGEPYARRSWKGLLTLVFNGIKTAGPVALVVFKDGRSSLITSVLDHQDLDQFIGESYRTLDMHERIGIARAFGSVIGTLHSRRIYHADLKACNIKIDPETREFFFLDTDRVGQQRHLSKDRVYENLVQINTSIPRFVSRGERMSFINAYAARTGQNPKEVFIRVWELSRTRGILYCSSEGDRFEGWIEK
ncbi:MAG TPA: hypothetical protein ENN34_06610 [Deltaproteobacteria bacterium]|nr:hypothetical protein [Deltaproteobacteria bacterium]